MTRTSKIVSIESVSFGYGDDLQDTVLALEDVSLEISAGELIGLVGQNGSGKTTLARHLNGLLKPGRGRVLVAGRDTREIETGHLADQVGYVFQNPDHALFLTTVREEITYSLSFQELSDDERDQRIHLALDAFNLAPVENAHPASLGRGMRRLVVLAAAYAMQPDLLVLDEPTGGLDRRLTRELVKTLREYVASGRSALLISHDMQLIADTCSRVLVLNEGRLVADCSPGELFTNEAILSQTRLSAPDIAHLAQRMSDTGISHGTVSMDEFVERYAALSREKARGRPG